MYAVFQIGNKQYRVFTQQIIHIEQVHVSIGNVLEFNQVLFVKDNNSFQVGDPFIKNMKITATVLDHYLSKKVKIIKFRRRKHYRKTQGHRQHFTKIKIINISADCSNPTI